MSCNFIGRFFGAPYPDACCIDGFLWDLDSCDEPGGPLQIGGEAPCPICNPELTLQAIKESLEWDEKRDKRRRSRLVKKLAKIRLQKFIQQAQDRWNDGKPFQPIPDEEEAQDANPF